MSLTQPCSGDQRSNETSVTVASVPGSDRAHSRTQLRCCRLCRCRPVLDGLGPLVVGSVDSNGTGERVVRCSEDQLLC